MSGVRRGARSVLKWFSPLYVVLIIVQVFLAGEGVFRLRTVYDSDTCKTRVCEVPRRSTHTASWDSY